MRLFPRIGKDCLVLSSPDYQEERTGHILLIWKDAPYWSVVDRELFALLSRLDGTRTLEDASGNASIPREVLRFLNTLLKMGVMKDARRSTKSKPPTKSTCARIESVHVNLTRHCNLACVSCYDTHPASIGDDSELSSAEYIGFLKDIKPFVGRSCTCTIFGGEPFLYPDKLFEVAEYAVSRGMQTTVSTNGTIVTDELAKHAKRMRLNVQVGIDGYMAPLNDSIRGDGSFVRTVGGIRTLTRNKVHTILNMVCHDEDSSRLGDFYHFAAELGVDEAKFTPMKQFGGASDERFVPARTKDLVNEAYQMLKRHPEFSALMGRDTLSVLANTCRYSIRRQSCGVGTQTVLLDSDGSIYPCLHTRFPAFRVANLRDEAFSFADSWKNSLVLDEIRSVSAVNSTDGKCSDCPVVYWCLGGCHGEKYAASGTMEKTPPNCDDRRESIIDVLWMISESPEVVKNGSIIC